MIGHTPDFDDVEPFVCHAGDCSYLQCVSMFLAERLVFLGEECLSFQGGTAHLNKQTNKQTPSHNGKTDDL